MKLYKIILYIYVFFILFNVNESAGFNLKVSHPGPGVISVDEHSFASRGRNCNMVSERLGGLLFASIREQDGKCFSEIVSQNEHLILNREALSALAELLMNEDVNNLSMPLKDKSTLMYSIHRVIVGRRQSDPILNDIRKKYLKLIVAAFLEDNRASIVAATTLGYWRKDEDIPIFESRFMGASDDLKDIILFNLAYICTSTSVKAWAVLEDKNKDWWADNNENISKYRSICSNLR